MARKISDFGTNAVIRAVAQQSNLTNAQVRECFKALRTIVEATAESPNRPENCVMVIPYIGNLKFTRIHKDPNREIKGYIKHVDLSKAVLKDEYDSLSFSVFPSLRMSVKELSYKFIKRQKEAYYGKEN